MFWYILCRSKQNGQFSCPSKTQFLLSYRFHIVYTNRSLATEEDVVNRMPKFEFIRDLCRFEIGRICAKNASSPSFFFFRHFFLLLFSLHFCCPIRFKLCTHLLLITSGPFFPFLEFPNIFQKNFDFFMFVIFPFWYLLTVRFRLNFLHTFYLSIRTSGLFFRFSSFIRFS